MVIGLDIGGANIKWASDKGSHGILYCPLWKDKGMDNLEKMLVELKDSLLPEDSRKVGVVMSGELADCFDTLTKGVISIAGVCERVFPDSVFLSMDGTFEDIAGVRDKPMKFAAANWMASALLVGRTFQDCVLVDMGSTTTDIIPLKEGVATARTDIERLANSELVYSGVLRTPAACLTSSVLLRGHRHLLAREFFATMGDVYTLLGWMDLSSYPWETADLRGKGQKECATRLAKLVCSELNELSIGEVKDMAKQLMEAQVYEISTAIERALSAHNLSMVVAAGLGEHLIAKACEEMGVECVLMAEKIGESSLSLPSHSLTMLLP